jgi:hypothetical protein
MPQVSVEDLLLILDQRKGAIIGPVLTLRSHKTPGEGMLVNKRGTSKKAGNLVQTVEVFPTGIHHVLRQQIMLATNYAAAVDRQRESETTAYMDKLPAPPKFLDPLPTPEVPKFEPEELWGGKGERDERFPKIVARHKETGMRYLCYRPHDGKPLLSEWYDVATGRKLDKEAELTDFLPPPKPDFSKAQGTEKMIPWQVCKLGNILSLKYGDEVYDIIQEREPVGV